MMRKTQMRSDLSWKNEQNNLTLHENKLEQLASWCKVLLFSHLYIFYLHLFLPVHSHATSQTSQPTSYVYFASVMTQPDSTSTASVPDIQVLRLDCSSHVT